MGLHEIYQLALAVGLGLLVGLQREQKPAKVAGIRTFPLITGFGYLCGLLALNLSPWVGPAGLLGVVVFMTLGNVELGHRGDPQPGMTSEFASLVMFLVGVILAMEWTGLAVMTAGVTLVLLQAKAPLRGLAERLGTADLNALAQLVLLGLVILPALPDRDMGPMGALNPREIWLMVVLIVGISLAAYVTYKFMGGRTGTLVAGVLGGLISSTASTLTFTRMTKGTPSLSQGAAVMIMLASVVVFARVLAELAVVAPGSLPTLAPPLVTMMAGMAAITFYMFHRLGSGLEAPAMDEPPSDLKAAVVFGGLYALILLGLTYAQEHMGDRGLYLVAFVSGLTDMDAITLSSANMVSDGQMSASTGWRVVLVGGMSNLLFKAGIAVALGGKGLRKPVLAGFAGSLAVGGLILALWP